MSFPAMKEDSLSSK